MLYELVKKKNKNRVNWTSRNVVFYWRSLRKNWNLSMTVHLYKNVSKWHLVLLLLQHKVFITFKTFEDIVPKLEVRIWNIVELYSHVLEKVSCSREKWSHEKSNLPVHFALSTSSCSLDLYPFVFDIYMTILLLSMLYSLKCNVKTILGFLVSILSYLKQRYNHIRLIGAYVELLIMTIKRFL